MLEIRIRTQQSLDPCAAERLLVSLLTSRGVKYYGLILRKQPAPVVSSTGRDFISTRPPGSPTKRTRDDRRQRQRRHDPDAARAQPGDASRLTVGARPAGADPGNVFHQRRRRIRAS